MNRLWPLVFLGSLAQAAPLDEARIALENGFPQVALVKIEEQFPIIGSRNSDANANLLYARALIESGQASSAVAIFETSKMPSGASRDFWYAQALAADGNWLKASKSYSLAAKDPNFEFQRESVIGLASMLKNLAKLDEAAATLAPTSGWPQSRIRSAALLDLAEIRLSQKNPMGARASLDDLQCDDPAQKSRRAFLLAQAASQEKNDALALSLLTEVEPLNAEMATSTVLLHAATLQRLSHSAECESMLEEFIATHPSLPGLEQVFANLDEIYAAATSPSSSELKRWSSESESNLRQKLATYYLARFETRQKNPEAALPLLERLAADPSSNPLAQETLFELAALRVRLGRNDEALALLPPTGTTTHTDFLRGLALSRKSDHTAAALAFASAASEPTLAESALFNAALCQLYSGNVTNTALLQLEKKFPSSPRISTFRLNEAYFLARKGDPMALASLEALTSSPVAGIASRARLALAEWKYQQLDYQGADAELRQISSQSDPSREAALKVFLMDTGDPTGTDSAIAAARTFLITHQNTESEPSIRMKLGELLYRRGDFATARVELETLAQRFPESEYGKPALFLAAQSTSRLPTTTSPDDAILLYEEVASGKGPLASQARLEQATILAAQGKRLEANLVLDKILSSNPEPEMLASALVEKGKNLYSLGDQDPANYRAAIDIWKQIVSEPSATPAWRNQALTRIGTALEKTGDLNSAVATYYDVFKPGTSAPAEFFWFYKAGFAAGRILESTEKWPEAIRVYQVLAASDGPRSLEAKNRIKQLRLEHFIWEEK
jgi:TolA-binding protein